MLSKWFNKEQKNSLLCGNLPKIIIEYIILASVNIILLFLIFKKIEFLFIKVYLFFLIFEP